jgi:hypothetical protein
MMGTALLLGLLASCPAAAAEPPKSLNLWPFYFHQKAGDRTDLEVLGPLYYREKTPDRLSYGVRPFYLYRHENQPPKTFSSVLYPLGTFRREPEYHRSFFFPFYFHDWRIAPNGKPASATVYFPFYWTGESPTLGRWRYILLWGGTFRGLFGADEIDYYSVFYIRQRTGDIVTRHYGWPIYSEQRGPGRWGVRVFPFYGYHEQEGRWSNGYVLWPLFTYGRREASLGKEAARYFWLFPFYGRARSFDGNSGSVEVLWPLFNYAWNDRTHYRAWKLPFPFYSGSRTDDVQTTNIWPFWGRRQWKGGSETYILGPLVYWAKVRAANMRRDELKVFPFFTHLSRTEPKRDLRYSYWLVWPFWRSRTAQEGDRWESMANSAQLSFFGESEEFDRNYNALLGLYEHKAASDGWRATSALLGLYRSESAPGWRAASVGPFASWSSGGGLTRASFLLGLVQTGTREGRRGWRIFSIPLGASLTPNQHPPADGAARGPQ